jgi:N-carbamoylputrescine amidase
MQGHAGANLIPLVACNRIGTETSLSASAQSITFYGGSFIAGPTGELIVGASTDREEIISTILDLKAIGRMRASWGVFRDRRPDLYGAILTLDGRRQHPSAAHSP